MPVYHFDNLTVSQKNKSKDGFSLVICHRVFLNSKQLLRTTLNLHERFMILVSWV